MELRQLRYFVAIVDHGSLSKAAVVLHIAQPALTQHCASSKTSSACSCCTVARKAC
jgi:DNA-binding transcriptional regulator YdaS (Cro superfamily)